MSKICNVNFKHVSISATQDLVSLKPASNKPIRILRYWLMCDEPTLPSPILLQLNAKITTGTFTAGSGGSAPTPTCLDPTNTTTISATARANDTTPGTTSTSFVNIDPSGTHIYNRFDSAQQGRAPIDIPVAGGFVFELLNATITAAHFSGGVDFEEIG